MASWPFDDLYESLNEQLSSLFGSSVDEGRSYDLSTLLAPVDPFNRSPLFTPVVRTLGAVGIVCLSGVALGGLAVALAAFAALYFLLTEVFGYELALAPVPGA